MGYHLNHPSVGEPAGIPESLPVEHRQPGGVNDRVQRGLGEEAHMLVQFREQRRSHKARNQTGCSREEIQPNRQPAPPPQQLQLDPVEPAAQARGQPGPLQRHLQHHQAARLKLAAFGDLPHEPHRIR